MRLQRSHPLPLRRTFLALLSHPSHQIAGVDSIFVGAFVGAFPPRPTYPPKQGDHARQQRLGRAYPQREAPILPPFRGTSLRLDSMNGLMPTMRKVIAMPARKSKAKSATRKKTAARKTTVAVRRPAAREEAGGQESHDPEKDGGRQEAGGQESHDPEEDSGP
jgi:hypothetical protein